MSLKTVHDKNYEAGIPTITDEEYDNLYGESASIGASIEGAVKASHLFTMYSLKKYYETDTLPVLSDPVESIKLDGAAIALQYSYGKLHRAVMRGDGNEGTDITDIVQYKALAPEFVSLFDKTSNADIVGEVVIPKDYSSNARNLAAGSLHLDMSNEANLEVIEDRPLYFVAYDARLDKGVLADTYRDVMDMLYFFGINTVLGSYIDLKVFPSDGTVYRENSYAEYHRQGFTAKHPRAAFALKQSSEVSIVDTTIDSIKWQVGRTGVVTPVAYVQPVYIDGALVSKASLDNVEMLLASGATVGSKVKITRRGGIIPRILDVIDAPAPNRLESTDEDSTHVSLQIPDLCPECGSDLEQRGPRLYCLAPDCPAKEIRRLTHFFSKLKVKGLGESRLESILFDYDSMEVPELGLFELTEEQWRSSLGKVGGIIHAQVQALLDGVPAERVIDALGIPLVGLTTAKKIVAEAKDCNSLWNMDKPDGVGQKAWNNFTYCEEWKRELICKLGMFNISANSTCSGTVVLSGKFTGQTKAQIEEVLTGLGYKVSSSVSAKTTYLVVENAKAPGTSSKVRKAQELNIPIKSYSDLIN